MMSILDAFILKASKNNYTSLWVHVFQRVSGDKERDFARWLGIFPDHFFHVHWKLHKSDIRSISENPKIEVTLFGTISSLCKCIWTDNTLFILSMSTGAWCRGCKPVLCTGEVPHWLKETHCTKENTQKWRLL